MSLFTPDLQYEVDNFAAGFLDSPDAAVLPKGATPSAANGFFSSVGAEGCKWSKRSGARLLNPACISAGKRVDGLYEFIREGVTGGELLAVCNGSLRKWDGANAFTVIAATGMAATSIVTFMTFRALCFVMNGTVSKFYDGTSLLDPGVAAPTAAPAIAAVAPAAAGVTGTYQSLATWYDSTHDHESSPSAQGAATVFAAQDRQHTKPTGAPAANYDKWRVYVRRTDTNETYFKLVAETVVGTATATEAVTDSARNLATTQLAPLPNANDAPPVFAFMGNGLGYRFGVTLADSYVWVSALGDPQSQHPKDKIGIARGDGNPLTTVKSIGTKIIAQKGRRTWQLVGDRMPFVPKEISGSFGNHQQDSSVEAAGRYWAWDDERGPYVTDLEGEWKSLMDGQIGTIFGTVNRAAEVRCCHYKEKGLVCWIVATGSATRTRTLLAYNYVVGAWLAPIYGIEYGSMSTFQLTSGAVNFYVGDQWGRVYQYFVDAIEGVPSGTVSAAVTAATSGTVTAGGAAFYTTNDGLKGMPCAVVDAAGHWQFRTILSNTGTVLTLDTTNGSAWSRVPDTTYTVIVGPIDFYWSSALINWAAPLRRKKGGYLYAQLRASGTANPTLVVRARLDDTAAALSVSESFALHGTSAWGTGLWGTMLWGQGNQQTGRRRLPRSFYAIQIEVSNRYPNQPVALVVVGITADIIKGRWANA